MATLSFKSCTPVALISEPEDPCLTPHANILKEVPDRSFQVEGHTDNVPYRSGILLDNWDLSVKRATAIVRILEKQYGLDPSKMAAAGRGEYKPVGENSTSEGKAINRRTRIVILPQLDQFFQLLETKK